MKLIECPRDAMQGLKNMIPTAEKVKYINSLLKVGFHTVDAGSFVSPKAMPQMADTKLVIPKLDLSSTKSKILVIVANKRGAEEAVQYDEVSYLGFPFSVSETFQERNINSNIKESLNRLAEIQNLCIKNNKELVTYFSMAFGNPYGDEWSPHIVAHWSEKLLNEFGIKVLSLSDTIGTSNRENIKWLFEKLINEFPDVEFGAHLHTNPSSWVEKIESAINSGCGRFDSAIKGYGGCPMADDQLMGNMATENLIDFLNKREISHGLNEEAFNESMQIAADIFP